MNNHAYYSDILDSWLTVIKTSLPLFVTIIVVSALFFLLLGIIFGRLVQKLKTKGVIKKEREDAVRQSRATLGGQFAEQVAPFLPGFPCNPGDAQFLGRPVDFVAFTGSAEGKDIEEILFIEVKTGKSSLNGRERQVREAVEAGRVRYVEYRLP